MIKKKLRTSIRYRLYWVRVKRRIFDRHPHTRWLDDKKLYYRHPFGFPAQELMMANMRRSHQNQHNFRWAKE